MYIHPTQARALTVREAARAQSFDDEFIFLGGLSQQFTLVGNAAPPQLAAEVARAVSTALALPADAVEAPMPEAIRGMSVNATQLGGARPMHPAGSAQ